MLREKFSQFNTGSVRLDPGEVEIRRLTAKLESDNEQESKKAAWSLANLTRSSHNRKMIISEGALPVLVSFLKDKSDSRKIHVLSIFTNLSQTAVYRKEIVATETLNSIFTVLKSSDTAFVEQSMEFIANMCLNRTAKELISTEKGVLDLIIGAMKNFNDSAKKHVVRALIQLSIMPDVASMLHKLNIMRYLVDLLIISEDWTLKTWIAEVISNLSSNTNNLSNFGSTSIWKLLDLLDAKSPDECKICALQALANLTQKEQLRKAVLRQSGIPLITGLVRQSNNNCVLMAVKCIANLTKDIDKVALCSRRRVIRVLVQLLEKKNSDALSAIANISEVPEQRLSLLQVGVVPHLVAFLKTPDPACQLDTLCCLAHISDVDVSIPWFLEESVIKSVVSLLRSSCLLSCSYAAQIVRNISESNHQGIQMIVESDAIWLLVRQLRSQSKTAVLSSVRALSVLSSNRNARALMNQFDGVTDLMRLMKQGSDEIKIYSGRVLYDLSICMEVQRYIACEGGIPTLISMLSSQNFEVREAALCLLVRLGLAKEHWAAIRDGGGFGPLVKQLLASEVRDALGVCQSFVKFFNAVIVTILKARFSRE
eukprot:g1873.t1